MILFEKYGQHQPLNRQSERYVREGIDLSLSTLADQVGACVHALRPLHDRIERHVLAAERLHGDDTTVPILAKGKTVTGRVWVYVRDDRPFGGAAPPAALFYASRDRTADHPERHLAGFGGILQADAYAGYGRLYAMERSPEPVIEALCWAHSRRRFFELADIARSARRGKNAAPISPLALEAVKRIDVLFDIEREMNGRWEGFARFTSDSRSCLSNNAAERALRALALGRKSWLFAGSDRGADRCAFMLTLIATAKLNDVDPQAWLADVLARIADTPQSRLGELLPWNWTDKDHRVERAAA